MNMNIRIMVVCGGTSTEREVSLRSGKAVYEALLRYGYQNTTLFDLGESNVGDILTARPDVVYLALHGKGGEDGSIQGMLELAGIPYTGSGIASSAICMDKIFTKRVLESVGLPSAKYAVRTAAECTDLKKTGEELVAELGLPLVLKAPCQGSSIGVVIVRRMEETEAALREVLSYEGRVLAEEFLSGTEITLSIIGNEELTVLPDIEITSEREFYDYKAKYTNGLCHHIIPARISEQDRERAREIGAAAYRALNCRGYARVDMFVEKDRGPMIVEINTLPGMTEMSLVPDAARAAGISFEELVSTVVTLALQKR